MEELLSRVVHCGSGEKKMTRLNGIRSCEHKPAWQAVMTGNTFIVSHFWNWLTRLKPWGRVFLYTQVPAPKSDRSFEVGVGMAPLARFITIGCYDDQRNQMDWAYLQDGLHQKTGQSAQWWELWLENWNARHWKTKTLFNTRLVGCTHRSLEMVAGRVTLKIHGGWGYNYIKMKV